MSDSLDGDKLDLLEEFDLLDGDEFEDDNDMAACAKDLEDKKLQNP